MTDLNIITKHVEHTRWDDEECNSGVTFTLVQSDKPVHLPTCFPSNDPYLTEGEWCAEPASIITVGHDMYLVIQRGKFK